MSANSTALMATGALLALTGAAFVLLDLSGHGDASGLDPEDLVFLAVGTLLAVVGAYLRYRKARTAA